METCREKQEQGTKQRLVRQQEKGRTPEQLGLDQAGTVDGGSSNDQQAGTTRGHSMHLLPTRRDKPCQWAPLALTCWEQQEDGAQSAVKLGQVWDKLLRHQ